VQGLVFEVRILLDRLGLRAQRLLHLAVVATAVTASVIIGELVGQTRRTLLVIALWISACGVTALLLARILHLTVPLPALLTVAVLGPVMVIWLLGFVLLPELLAYGPPSE
jgi:hypothetical protein